MTPEDARDKITIHKHDVNNTSNAVDQLRVLAGLCNSGEFDAASVHLPLHQRKINGDATDTAILRFSESLGETSYLHHLWKREFELAFNSKNKFMIRTYSLVEAEALESAVSQSEQIVYGSDDS